MFQPSSTLSFTASSAAGITNVTVQLTVTSLYTGSSFIKNLSAGHGLTITGPSTGENVSAALTSNTLYSAIIRIQDANGSVASQTNAFDTITPAYTWEAEDWNYTDTNTLTSGLYKDNPQTNAYAGLATTTNVDAANNNGPGAYRPSVPGLSTENASDIPRLKYVGTGFQDYDVGWTDGGEFGNYTRHYPAGTYNLFVRASGGNGPKTEAADISVVSGTATISSAGSSPYKYGIQGRGWQSYDFMPVTDNAGNLIQITFDSSVSTLQEIQVQANDNINFFMLMPINTNVVASTVTITNISPDGSALFNPAGTFSFTATSPPSSPIDPANILLQVTATNLYGHGWSSNLTSTSGLTISGPSTNLNVSFLTTTNTIYTVNIQITDSDGNEVSSIVSFDTIIPTYTFEAEDFDYGGGQFFDNPQTNAYKGFDGVTNVDYSEDAQHGAAYLRFGLTTENLNEKQRPQYNGTGFQDYDVGFNDGGNWGNYTRNYPAGTYNIYVRGANGTGNTSADSGSISLVTSGLGTTNQTVAKLGTFSVPAIAWSTYGFYPVKDSGGNLAQFTGGSLETLRMTIDGGNCNENFFLLTPADPSAVLLPFVDTFQPDGSALFQPSNTLSFIVHSQPGTATSNIVLNLNGANVSGLTFGGTPNIRNVSYPIQLNVYYTAIVTVTDAHGTVATTNTFGTFNSTDYQWEAEDYDHDSGQFSDNPQTNAYNGLGSTPGVDNNQSDLGASPFLYRLNSPGPSTTVAGDMPRAQFAGGGTDYNIGFFGHNSWANYTRHYPVGTYTVIGRFAEGNAATEDTLSQLTSGYGTSNQTLNALGTFHIAPKGWSAWEWEQLTDGSGNPVRITLDGSLQTLQLEGTSVTNHDEANVNFFMLLPVTPTPKLTATISGGNIHISFPTQTGYTYLVQWKSHLTDASWTLLASLPGNNAVQSVSDPSTVGSRFYRVQIQ